MEIGLLLTDNLTDREKEFKTKKINYSFGIDLEELFFDINLLETQFATDREVLQELKKFLLIYMGKLKIEDKQNGNEKVRDE